MAIQWHDVTIPMRPGMTVWPGDPEFEFEAASRIQAGASCNTSLLRLSTHTGTHCDAPWHFEEGGKRLHEVDSALFFGPALLIEWPERRSIRADDLPGGPLPPRVLFKTPNSERSTDGPFFADFVALEEDAAQRLVELGVRLVGIDYLSVAPKGQSGPTHHALLQREVFVVEGLRLAGMPPGLHEFIVLPMPLVDADGAPCRAFLGVRMP